MQNKSINQSINQSISMCNFPVS